MRRIEYILKWWREKDNLYLDVAVRYSLREIKKIREKLKEQGIKRIGKIRFHVVRIGDLRVRA